MGMGSVIVLLGYIGYFAFYILFGLIGVGILIYDLFPSRKRREREREVAEKLQREEIQRYGVPLIGKAVALTEIALARGLEPFAQWDTVYHVTGVSEDGLSLTTKEGVHLFHPIHWGTERIVKK